MGVGVGMGWWGGADYGKIIPTSFHNHTAPGWIPKYLIRFPGMRAVGVGVCWGEEGGSVKRLSGRRV